MAVSRDVVEKLLKLLELAEELSDSAETPKMVKPVRGTVQQREKETRVLEALEQR